MKSRLLIVLFSLGALLACGKSDGKKVKLNEERELVLADSVSHLIQIEIQDLSSKTDSLYILINDLKE